MGRSNATSQDRTFPARFTGSFNGEYLIPGRLTTADGDFFIGLEVYGRTGFSSSPSPSAFMNVEGYVLLSPRLGFRARQWQAWFWSRNVTDTHYFNYLTAQPWGSGLIVGEPGNPRTFGATLAVQF